MSIQVHELKTDSTPFYQTTRGEKTFEIRKDDRNFQAGDVLILKETLYTGEQMANGCALVYTGNELAVMITDIMVGPCYGLQEGWAILSIKVC